MIDVLQKLGEIGRIVQKGAWVDVEIKTSVFI